MARCIFCGEWAGGNAEWHQGCLREFEECMERPGVLRRVMASSVRSAVAAFLFVLGLFAPATHPARTPPARTQHSPASQGSGAPGARAVSGARRGQDRML